MAVNHDNQQMVPAGKTQPSASRQRGGLWQRFRGIRRGLSIVAIIVLPLALLALVAAGVVYVRLANGPVSLSFLKPTIERQIAEKLGGLGVEVSDVVLSLVGRQAEFRLNDVQVTDKTGAVVAQAPLASMEIDRAALFKGLVSPTGIVLIRPVMRLAYNASDGLSLTFKKTASTPGDAGSTTEPAIARAIVVPPASSTPNRPDLAAAEGGSSDITILRTIAQLLRDMNQGRVGLSLDHIGVRNALIEFDHAGVVSRLGVPSGDLQFDQTSDRGVVSGLATIAKAEGQNITLSFHAEASPKTDKIVLRSSIRDVRPDTFAEISPGLDLLKGVAIPLSANANFNLTGNGEIVDGRVTVEAAAGLVRHSPGTAPFQLDHARVEFVVDQTQSGIAIAPSTISWGRGNRLVVSGRSEATDHGRWRFALNAESGHLVAKPGAKVAEPIERWSMDGRYWPKQSTLLIDRHEVAVSGGSLFVKASMSMSAARTFGIEGRLGPGPTRALSYLWPMDLSADAREWTRKNIVAGQITSGQFSSFWTVDAKGRIRDEKTSASMQARDIQVASRFTRLPAYLTQARLQLGDNRLQVTAPSATIQVRLARALQLTDIKFNVSDMRADKSVGVLSFKTAGRLRNGLAVLAAMPKASGASPGFLSGQASKVTGHIDGALAVTLPLNQSDNDPIGMSGEFQLRDVHAKNVLGRHNLSGGVFKLQVDDKAIKLDGEMLLAGVAGNVTWQYIIGAPIGSQPPLRLSARLDETDRDKLGIAINHMVGGLMDVSVNLVPLEGGQFGSKVRADLTKSRISVQSLAWVKPAGRQTVVEFDVTNGSRSTLALENLRIVGDGIAIQGSGVLDKSYQLKAFELPKFSIDRVTRLAIKGQRQKGGVWRVAVNGQTFEGRALFRSLFQAGRAGARGILPGAAQQGVDLEAEVSNVLGFWNTQLRNVRMSLSKRNGAIQSMQLEGRLKGNKLLKAAIVKGRRQTRELHAFSADAGGAFRLVGFYPSARRGRLELVVNLDAAGPADKSGVLLVRDFQVRGDEVVGELARARGRAVQRKRVRRKGNDGQALDFDWMRVPFFIGNGQFILQGAELRGPVVGATIEGKADFEARRLDLSGTYVPLQGLNGAIGVIPGLGQILAGPNGEGVLGMKFALRGPMAAPEMLVNPLSMMAPGIFREMFQITNPSLEVTERSQRAAPKAKTPGNKRRRRQRRKKNWRSGAFGGDD